MQSNNTDYKNVMVTGIWETKNGHFSSMPIDAKAYDTLTRALEQGGKFFIRKRSEESLAKSKNPEKAPKFYLEFMPSSVVKDFEASRDHRGSKGL